MEVTNLINKCDTILEGIQNGQNWVQTNTSNEEQNYTIHELKRYARKFNKLKASLNQRPTVAIFGPSQVGKSYLVSHLVRSEESTDLIIKDPITTEPLSFIKDMNPYGGKESTGTVTRFTTTPSSPLGYKIKLLQPKDIICIILNGYFLDIKEHQYQPSIEDFQAKLNQLSELSSNSEFSILTEDDLFEIKDYITDTLGLSNNVTIIHRLNELNFWKKSAKIISKLDLEHLSILFSLIWGEQPFFNKLLLKLFVELQKFDFQTIIYCNKRALSPNNKTILDVERVRELFDNKKPLDFVEIKTSDGRSFQVDRRILSALTAEVNLNISKPQNTSRQYLKDSDVLDFPGARSREHIPEQVFKVNQTEAQLQLFVRGKVAYLFDLYNADFGISTLLYCMDDGNPEVQSIPNLLYNWIEQFIGKSPKERKKRLDQLKNLTESNDIEANPLLVVLTKFDVELTGKESEKEGMPETHDGKWVARLEENFKNFMIRPLKDEWVTNWVDNTTFKNVFPLRNPNFSKSIFLRQQGAELQYNDDYKVKMTDMRASFVRHHAVRSYIRHPKEIWNEFALPQKTGADYIIKYLTPTCHPKIKLNFLREALNVNLNEVLNLLGKYYISDDITELLKIAKRNSLKSAGYLMRLTQGDNNFGLFLNQLLITEQETYFCYRDIQIPSIIDNAPKSTKQTTINLSSSRVSFLELLENVYGIKTNQSPEAIIEELKQKFDASIEELEEFLLEGETFNDIFNMESEEKTATNDKAWIFVDAIISQWISKVEQYKHHSTSSELKTILIDELIKTRKTINLRKILYGAIKQEVDNFATSHRLDIVVRITFQIINNFVNTFGWYYIEEQDRPKDKQGSYIFYTKVIDYKSISPNLDSKNFKRKLPGIQLIEHWSKGCRAAFINNVRASSGVQDLKDIENNQALNRILEQLKTTQNAS